MVHTCFVLRTPEQMQREFGFDSPHLNLTERNNIFSLPSSSNPPCKLSTLNVRVEMGRGVGLKRRELGVRLPR